MVWCLGKCVVWGPGALGVLGAGSLFAGFVLVSRAFKVWGGYGITELAALAEEPKGDYM